MPVLALQAKDDPFMEAESFPTEEDVGEAAIRLVYHDHGGHCAFVTANAEENERGWLAEELARFGAHVARSTDPQQ